MLTKIKKELFFIKNGSKTIITYENLSELKLDIRGDVSRIWGDVSSISGDVSRIWGDVSSISGDVSRIWGDVSRIWGDVSKARREYFIKLKTVDDGQTLDVELLCD